VASSGSVVWNLDNLDDIGGCRTTVVGAPRIVSCDAGKAIEFDGKQDGLFIAVNPLKDLERFTLEVVFKPYEGGTKAQRFLHVGENHGDRVLLETREAGPGFWCLDVFLSSKNNSSTLLSRDRAHALGRWYRVACVFDGRNVASLVDDQLELTDSLVFTPLKSGLTSIGVRQNKVSWFKGAILRIKIAPDI